MSMPGQELGLPAGLLNDFFPCLLPCGFSIYNLSFLVAGGEAGAAEVAGEGAHPCKGEH